MLYLLLLFSLGSAYKNIYPCVINGYWSLVSCEFYNQPYTTWTFNSSDECEMSAFILGVKSDCTSYIRFFNDPFRCRDVNSSFVLNKCYNLPGAYYLYTLFK